jgi:hypothetical protein
VTVEKTVSITYSECVLVATIIQRVKRMRRVLLSVGATILLYLSLKRRNFRKNVIEYKMCFDFVYNFSLKHFLC